MEVEIEFKGKKEKVKLKKLSFGERNQLEEEATDIKIVGGQPIVKVSTSKMKEIALLKSIVDAPFPVSIQAIRDLDLESGNALFEAFTELNQMNEKKSVS
jgi:hypothetical protein